MRETTFVVKKIVIFDKAFSYNVDTLVFSIAISLIIFFLCLWLKARLQFIPTKRQVVLEGMLDWFDGVLKESLGQRGRLFLGLIVTLFLFILVSNWSGIIPGFLSPTRDLNTCLGMALMVLTVAHINSMKTKGIKKYLKSYFQPYWWLLPSNVFAEISKTLSHSFRLFGNIFAGSIILALIPSIIIRLLKLWGIPLVIVSSPIVNAFFGIFIGGVQAFVFTILAVTYIGVLAQE
jgi:F-type H+-transporting ATPase subunit a